MEGSLQCNKQKLSLTSCFLFFVNPVPGMPNDVTITLSKNAVRDVTVINIIIYIYIIILL